MANWRVFVDHERIAMMALFRVKPTSIDERLAKKITSGASPVPEEVAGGLSWGADEHLLLGCAAAAWIALTITRSPLRPASSHFLLIAAASAALPHGLKLVFDQVRPDRKTLRGHLHGIPLSGDRLDAFPSGHAVHMGALASVASVLPPRYKLPIWGVAVGLSATRVAILAHWLSDVVVGFTIGVVLERAARRFTGYPDAYFRRVLSRGRKR
jgi:membrane-associated phospholipid phosphatase